MDDLASKSSIIVCQDDERVNVTAGGIARGVSGLALDSLGRLMMLKAATTSSDSGEALTGTDSGPISCNISVVLVDGVSATECVHYVRELESLFLQGALSLVLAALTLVFFWPVDSALGTSL